MPNANDNLEKLKNEYIEKYSLYEKFCLEIVKQLEELLFQKGIKTAVPIHFRVKKWDSLCEKCDRFSIIPKGLDNINDLAGIRIVLLFKRDLENTCKIIEKIFKILAKEDTQQRLADNQFGYSSIHYLLYPPKNWFNIPTLSGLQGLKFELQVRTASQHIWAEASHILQYKQEKDIPVPLRRNINNIAALLETVDSDFEHILKSRDKYVSSLEKITDNKESLNVDSLRKLLDKLLPKENLDSGKEIYAELLDELRFLEIKTLKQVEDIIVRQLDKVKEEEKRNVEEKKRELSLGKQVLGSSVERISKGVFFTHVGLARGALRFEFGEKFAVYLLSKYKGK